jgi:hypothetical protein
MFVRVGQVYKTESTSVGEESSTYKHEGGKQCFGMSATSTWGKS